MNPSGRTVVSVDPELLDLFPRYIANRGRDIEAVTASLERGDFQLIRSIGHNMHGSGRSFGLDEISAIGAAIESAALAADHAGVQCQLPRITACLARIRLDAQLPAKPGRSAPPAPAFSPFARLSPDGEAYDVLVVDDQEINVAIIGRFLSREGYRVRALDSGEAALKALGVPPLPALILLDVVMDGADGLETCRRIKSNPATRAIPVVLVSSAGSGEDRIRGWAAGADGFLTKPVCRLALVERVRALLPAGKGARVGAQAEPR